MTNSLHKRTEVCLARGKQPAATSEDLSRTYKLYIRSQLRWRCQLCITDVEAILLLRRASMGRLAREYHDVVNMDTTLKTEDKNVEGPSHSRNSLGPPECRHLGSPHQTEGLR